MAAPVDIANLALSFIGANTIAALDEASTNAELCNRAYPVARDHALEAFDWSFASTRVADVVADATPPAFGYLYRYTVPGNSIIVRQAFDATGIELSGWKQEGGFLLTNDAGPLSIRYTAKVTDTTLFSSALIEAMAYRLASLITISINENANLKQTLLQEYARSLQEAMLFDGTRKTKDTIPDARAWPVDPVTGATIDSTGKPLYVPDSVRAR